MVDLDDVLSSQQIGIPQLFEVRTYSGERS